MRAVAVSLVLALVPACGREIVQTAELAPSPREGFDCEAEPGDVELPNGPPFGDGSEPPSELVGDSYGPEEGPGLFVVARDRFRVYLNGELVTESEAERTPAFVPLTVLPGDNVLAVVVTAGSGPPALLLELDELERKYTSDRTFRVSTSPSGDFHAPDYDDSAWEVAQESGSLGSLPGCDPSSVFSSISDARWILPASVGTTAVFRKTIRIAAQGFGAGTTGGYGARPILVTTFDELDEALSEADTPAVILLREGIHDFRATGGDVREALACPIPCDNDPNKFADTLLTNMATCPVELVMRTRNERQLSFGSNKTLVGLGRGAALRGVTTEISGVQNVIARNIAVYDVNRALIEAGDAFGLQASDGVWLDHCTARWVSDGFTDIRPGAQNVTFSWIRYDGVAPDACDGFHPRASQISDSVATIHHSFFDNLVGNSPTVDHPLAEVHLYNNVFSGNLDYSVGAGCSAQVLLEGNVFEAVESPTYRRDCSDDTSLGRINAPAGSNLYRDDVGAHRGGDGMEPHDDVFVPPYDVTVATANDEWPIVISRAGAGGPWPLPLSLD